MENMFEHKYPNENLHELDLTWLNKRVTELEAAYKAFLAANSITFADPILWDITKQYSKNTIVLSTEGDAFLSKQPVGSGIQLNNTDYWLEIFNFAEYVRTANSNLTVHIEQNTTRATASYSVDDWLLWDDVLYKVTAAISDDDLLIIGTNIVHFTVEDFCRAWQTYMINTIAQYKADIDASELAYKNEIDASELAYRNQLAQDIATTTASLQAQLNAAIAGATVDSEVINARVGWNGHTYSTLREAITGQIKDILYRYVPTLDEASLYEHGNLLNGVDDSYSSGNRIRTPLLCADYDISIFQTTPGDQGYQIHLFDGHGTFTGKIPSSGWGTETLIPKGTIFRLLLTSDKNVSTDTPQSISDILDYFVFIVHNNFNDYAISRYVRGTVSASGYTPYHKDYRIVSMIANRQPYDLKVIANNAKFNVWYYDEEGSLIGRYPTSGWLTEGVIPKNKFYKIMMTVDDATAYTTTEILSHFNFELVNSFYDCLYTGDFSSYFEHGNILNGNDDSYNANARARCRITSCAKDLHVILKSGTYILFTFNSDGTYLQKTQWRTNDIIIPANTLFRLLVTEDPDSSTLTDIDTILEGIEIKALDNYYGLNPNILYQARNVDSTSIPAESTWYVKAAAENQYDRVRFTIRKTTDGYWFNCHDENINNLARNPDGSEIETEVSAEGKTLAELNYYDWGIQYGKQYEGADVPLFEDCLQYAGVLNLGVTVHFVRTAAETENNIDEIKGLLDKYGVLDNAIIISASGHNFNTFNRFHDYNPRISYYVGGDATFFSNDDNIQAIKALQTPYNKIYVQLYPWGIAPDPSFIELAKSNNFILYNSITMSRSDLLNLDTFNKGYGLMEVNNTYMIKDTVRNWLRSL